MKNSLGKEIPEYIEGYGKTELFQGAWTKLNKGWMNEKTSPPPVKASKPHFNKLCDSLEDAIKKCNPHDGMVVSFHHHLRGGDYLVIKTIEILDKLGIKDITLAASSLTTAHDGLVPYLRKKTITRIFSSGIRGKLGEAITMGILDTPVVIHSHGGRVRAIQTGEINIDLAIVGVSAADEEGNATGSHGKSAFGSVGYAMIDTWYANRVVVVTDNMVEYPCVPPSIRQNYVDYVVKVDTIGDASKIASGTTRITKAPLDLRIAQLAADAIIHSGHFKNGMSFVSSSILNNTYHIEIPSGLYANPYNCGCMTNKLDIVVLGALEIDTNFNVNVITGNDGNIRGASGGHCDTASGAQLTVVVCPSFRGRMPIVKREIHNIVTPGETVDILVTERGTCVNPLRPELEERLIEAGLNIRKIEDLAKEVEQFTGVPAKVELNDRIVGIIEYRDGTVIDVIKQTKGNLNDLYEELNLL